MEELLILHVEDDDASALLVGVALQELGAAVQRHRVCDVDSALQFLGGQASPSITSLVLLDLNLPRKSGFEMLQNMRDSTSLPAVPVVVLTSSGAKVDKQRAADLGAAGYIIKPSTFEGYVDAVREVVRLAGHSEVEAVATSSDLKNNPSL